MLRGSNFTRVKRAFQSGSECLRLSGQSLYTEKNSEQNYNKNINFSSNSFWLVLIVQPIIFGRNRDSAVGK
jgi:hypothetical protein